MHIAAAAVLIILVLICAYGMWWERRNMPKQPRQDKWISVLVTYYDYSQHRFESQMPRELILHGLLMERGIRMNGGNIDVPYEIDRHANGDITVRQGPK